MTHDEDEKLEISAARAQADNALHGDQKSIPVTSVSSPLSPPAVPSVLKHLGLGEAAYQKTRASSDQLITLLKNEDWTVRVAAIRKLSRLQEAIALEHFLPLLHDERVEVRAATLRALGKISVPVPLDPIVAALQDRAWEVRASSLTALKQYATIAPIEPVMIALHDVDESVRMAAISTLAAFGERIPVERLVTALQDPVWSVRETAVHALAKRPCQTVFDALVAALEDEDLSVRTAADQVLHQMDQQGLPPLTLSTQPLQAAVPRTLPERKPYPQWQRVLGRVLAAAVVIGIGLAWWYVAHIPNTSLTGSSVAITSAQYQDPSMDGVTLASWSPEDADGQRDIAFVEKNGTIRVWNTGTNTLEATYGPFQHVLAITWAAAHIRIASLQPDGSLLLTQVDGGNHPLWSLAAPSSGTQITPLISWSPDGKLLALVWNGQQTVQVCRLSDFTCHVVYTTYASNITHLAWSMDGKMLASASNDGQTTKIEMWNATTSKIVLTPVSITILDVVALSWSPDGQRLAYALNDGSVYVQRADISNQLSVDAFGRKLGTKPDQPWQGVLAWSPDGQRLAATTRQGLIRVWDADSGIFLATYSNHHSPVIALVWSNDSKHAVSVGSNGMAYVWEVL